MVCWCAHGLHFVEKRSGVCKPLGGGVGHPRAMGIECSLEVEFSLMGSGLNSPVREPCLQPCEWEGTGGLPGRWICRKDLFYWAKNVYESGCAFIHLSSFHDYTSRDPMERVSPAERSTIASCPNYYHRVHLSPDVRFSEILPYLPAVFEKIRSNLECYLKD